MHNRTLRQFAVLVAMVLGGTGLLMAAAEGNFERTLKVTGPVDMEVLTGSGYIHVTTGAAGTVAVKAHVSVGEHLLAGESAEARLQRILSHPPLEQTGNIVRIGHVDDPELRQNVSISYDLVVPAETRLTSKTGSGDQSVEGIRGPLEMATGSGGLKAASIGGAVRASTGSGDINLQGANGNVQASTGSGTIRAVRVAGGFEASSGSGGIHLEQTAAGSVHASAGSGDIELHGVKGGLTVGTGSGDVQVEGEPAASWRVETASGSVRLQLPPQAGFEFSAHTSSGSINIAEVHQLTVSGTVTRHELRGRAHGGGNLVEVRTASGSIEVR